MSKITQEEIHNMIVNNYSDTQKLGFSSACGHDIEAMMKIEQIIADCFNNASDMARKALKYLNTEIKTADTLYAEADNEQMD